MRTDVKIGMIAGVVLVIGTTLVFSLWPGSSVEDRLQRMQQQQLHAEPPDAAPGNEAIRPLTPVRSSNAEAPAPTPATRDQTAASDAEVLRQLQEQARRAVAGREAPSPPPTAESAEATTSTPSARTLQIHTVQRDETLSHISQKYYGTANKWNLILQANPDVIKDPDRVRPGMRLRIPEPQD